MKMKNQAAIVLSALLLAGCGGLGKRELEIYETARGALDRGDWGRAAELARTVIEAEPGYGPAYLLRGRALFELGKYPEALEDLDRAESRGGLADEEEFLAVLYRGRSWVELGRARFPDAEIRSEKVPADDRKEARDLFVKANVTLLQAFEMRPDSYEANLWRGYALLRVDNYRKALDTLKACEAIEPARWEHRFFTALAWEGTYKVNSQSIETYLELVGSAPRVELAPVYDHVAGIAGEVAPEIYRKILAAVREYAAVAPARSPRIERFLAEALAREETERRQLKLKATVERVQDFLERERFRDALALIESYLKEEGDHPDMGRMLRETEENWSQLLEARTEALMTASDRENLELALRNFELARKLTKKVDRLVVLQQKMNIVELALTRFETSRKIRDTYGLLKSGKHREVLQALAGTSVEGLSETDRDLYHYLRGAASYHLGQWAAAAKSFSAMSTRNFDSLDVLHGLALVRCGQQSAGVAMLMNTPTEGRGDEVNRILGQHFGERGDQRKAAGYLAAIKNPTPADLEAHLRARRRLGMDAFDRGDFSRAVEEFQAARQILEVQLEQRATDVYLYLGHAYFRMEDFERAKKTYQDLSESNLTAAEKEQCRDLYVHRGQVHLKEKNPDLAYRDFAEFVKLGGQIPQEMAAAYGRLVALYADFMPLDKVQYWNYASTTRDYNYTLYVKSSSGGEHIVERREAGKTSEEVWSRQGIYLTRKVGESIFKVPINLQPAEEALPFVEYTSQGQDCTAEIVAIQQTVELPGGRKFDECLKTRVRRSSKGSDGKVHSTKHIFYFAPGVGEVKQEVYRDDAKVSEIILSDFAYRAADVGN
jgi:tetratricopeptide (TPR) repeat protein